MIVEAQISTMDEWRTAARNFLMAGVLPQDISWNAPQQSGLFADTIKNNNHHAPAATVPREFLELAQKVACYRDNKKWSILYRVLWRMVNEERHLLKITTDDDVRALYLMAKQVSRDAHKMKAFVRFRKIEDEENSYVAWHEPTHLVVDYTAPFFQRRFTAMKWSILTPDRCAHWNGEKLSFTEGVSRDHALNHDEMEELWKTFYRNIFNPARIKTKMMKSEMPVKYWHNMPETALIPQMLEEADERLKKMLEQM